MSTDQDATEPRQGSGENRENLLDIIIKVAGIRRNDDGHLIIDSRSRDNIETTMATIREDLASGKIGGEFKDKAEEVLSFLEANLSLCSLPPPSAAFNPFDPPAVGATSAPPEGQPQGEHVMTNEANEQKLKIEGSEAEEASGAGRTSLSSGVVVTGDHAEGDEQTTEVEEAEIEDEEEEDEEESETEDSDAEASRPTPPPIQQPIVGITSLRKQPLPPGRPRPVSPPPAPKPDAATNETAATPPARAVSEAPTRIEGRTTTQPKVTELATPMPSDLAVTSKSEPPPGKAQKEAANDADAPKPGPSVPPPVSKPVGADALAQTKIAPSIPPPPRLPASAPAAEPAPVAKAPEAPAALPSVIIQEPEAPTQSAPVAAPVAANVPQANTEKSTSSPALDESRMSHVDAASKAAAEKTEATTIPTKAKETKKPFISKAAFAAIGTLLAVLGAFTIYVFNSDFSKKPMPASCEPVTVDGLKKYLHQGDPTNFVYFESAETEGVLKAEGLDLKPKKETAPIYDVTAAKICRSGGECMPVTVDGLKKYLHQGDPTNFVYFESAETEGVLKAEGLDLKPKKETAPIYDVTAAKICH